MSTGSECSSSSHALSCFQVKAILTTLKDVKNSPLKPLNMFWEWTRFSTLEIALRTLERSSGGTGPCSVSTPMELMRLLSGLNNTTTTSSSGGLPNRRVLITGRFIIIVNDKLISTSPTTRNYGTLLVSLISLQCHVY